MVSTSFSSKLSALVEGVRFPFVYRGVDVLNFPGTFALGYL
jgi:hypothetical protein